MRNLFRFAYVLICSVGISVSSYGKTVDESTAKVIGSNFLISVGAAGVNSVSDLATSYVATGMINNTVVNDYYVFNINGSTGFVMVSADDIVTPILAYSKESSFDINNMAPAAKRWIDGYKNEITYVIEHSVPAQPGVAENWNELKSAPHNTGAKTTVVTALLTTKWDQGSWYNYLCPGSGSGKAVTGCVATAMAQIMKYWNWPTIGTGYHTYTSAGYGALSANFGNTAYDWTNMPNTVTIGTRVPIGTLMMHAGVAVDMDYSATESGAYVTEVTSPVAYCAEAAFKDYFHYKRSIKGIARDGGPGGIPAALTPTAWINLLKGQMDAHRPVLYTGASVTAGGHAWVCDGYDASNKMHFNFGWGGASDGYYTVDNINPPALGIGGGGGNFNSNQTVIVNIVPDSFPNTTTANLKMLAHLSCTNNSPMPYYSGFSIVTKIKNGGTATFNGDFAAQVFDTLNNLVGTMQTLTGKTIAAGDSTASLTFSTTGLYAMIPGRYGVRIMYRASATAPWSVVSNNGNFINYNMMRVTNSQVIALYDSLHVGSHTIVRGTGITINTQIANLGTATFSGNVQAVLVNLATGNKYTVQLLTGQTITGYHFQPISFTSPSITAPAGNYILAIQHLPGTTGTYIYTGSDLYQNPVNFKIVSSVDVDEPVLAADNIAVYPNPANDVVYIDLKGATVSEISITDIQGREMKTMRPDSQSIISVPVQDYAPGVYFVRFMAGSEVVTKKITIAK